MFRDKFSRRKHLNGFRCHKVLQWKLVRILLSPNCWKILSKIAAMHYLPRNVVTDQFVDFFAFSGCLCSIRWLSSFSLKLANLLVLAGGSSKNWRSKYDSSHEIPSSSPEELIVFLFLFFPIFEEKTKIEMMFQKVATSMIKVTEKQCKTNWRQRATHGEMDRAY